MPTIPEPYKGVGCMSGSIQYSKKGRRYYISVYWQGKYHKIWSNPATHEKFYDKRQARRILTAIRHEIDQGAFNPKQWKPENPLILNTYYEGWLKSNPKRSEKTNRDYKGYFINHTLPNIGDMDIRHIRYKHLEKLYNSLKLSDKAKYNVLGALRTMLRWAYRSEDIQQIPPFPVLSFELPEIEYLTFEQQEKIISFIPEDDRPIFEFGMEYGLRTQEVRALQKDCITDETVLIKRSFSDNTLQEHTKTKKTRVEPMTEAADEIISRARKTLSPFIFVRKDGNPYSNKNMNTIWRKACKAAGINIKLQAAFRHSLGCQLLDQGEDLELVRDVLGHTKSDMTRRYAKRNPATVRAALEKRRKVIPLHSETIPKGKKSGSDNQ
jgi:integrase